MNDLATLPRATGQADRLARFPLVADWMDAVFLHFAVAPERLQPQVPFALDAHAGLAWVSVVAFMQCGLRLRAGGAATAWLGRPLATHAFCNLRTYVRHRGEPGIHFLAEWIPNRLALLLGPALFGLPYRPGRLAYRNHDASALAGRVEAAGGGLAYRANAPAPGAAASVAEPGGLAHFLLERYAAFTAHGARRLGFRIRHEPWLAREVRPTLVDDGLLRASGGWYGAAKLVCAHHSAGVRAVRIGAPFACRDRADGGGFAGRG